MKTCNPDELKMIHRTMSLLLASLRLDSIFVVTERCGLLELHSAIPGTEECETIGLLTKAVSDAIRDLNIPVFRERDLGSQNQVN